MEQLETWLTSEYLVAAGRALVLVLAGFLLARVLGRLATRLTRDRVEPQQALLVRRFVYWGILLLFLVTALHQLGFDLGVLLGAAGIVSVAVGFASQTSASNLISGLFLIAEKPFTIGDVIQIGGTSGEVLSVDLLSVKLRTFDNRFVRIPNESVIKSEVATLTKFPIRRIDLQIGVAYHEDLTHVREVLGAVADRNLGCLDEPQPLFIFKGFGESSMDIQFSVWAAKESYLEVKNAIQFEIKEAFDAAEIDIPFPNRTLHGSTHSQALQVELVPPATAT